MHGLALDYIRMFAAVDKYGGFAAAARALDKPQPVVTYAVKQLETQLDVLLFDRSTYRPTLTAAGKALLPHAKTLISQTEAFDTLAQSMSKGLEPEIVVAMDTLFPLQDIIPALEDFQEKYPALQLSLYTESLNTTFDMLRQGKADMGLLTRTPPHNDELQLHYLFQIELVAVSAPTHALARSPTPIAMDAVRGELQIILGERLNKPKNLDYGVHSAHTWHVNDIGTKLTLLRQGLGWGSLPRFTAADDLASGRLVELQMESWDDASPRMPELQALLAKSVKRPLGPAGNWLMQRFRECRSAPEG